MSLFSCQDTCNYHVASDDGDVRSFHNEVSMHDWSYRTYVNALWVTNKLGLYWSYLRRISSDWAGHCLTSSWVFGITEATGYEEISMLKSMLIKTFSNLVSDWLATQPPANQKPCKETFVN